MACCSPAVARKACERCLASELFCKSAWTAQRQGGTTSIVGPEHGLERAQVFSTLVRRGLECGWLQPFQLMPRLRSSVSSSTKRRLPQRTESYAVWRCAALPAKVLPSVEPIWCRKSRLVLMVCTGIRWGRKMPTCWLRTTSFLWLSPSLPSAALSSAKANTQVDWRESLTVREACPRLRPKIWLVEEPAERWCDN